MRLTATDRAGLERSIDDRCAPDRSIVLRYARAVRLCDDAGEDAEVKAGLERNSLDEGARILPLLEYRGVEVSVLDETSLMSTGTLKAVDGCLTASLLQASGATRVAFESGGNTGAALTAYGQRAGIETFFFCPNENLDLLDSQLFRARTAHLIGVQDRHRVKELAACFASMASIQRVPLREWRLGASLFRGLFLLEQLWQGRSYDWLAQTVSAGFGPIGIYRVLRAFKDELGPLPRFLGVQQAANAPVYRAWQGAPAGEARPAESGGPDRLLSRVMYDAVPQTYGTVEDLLAVVHSTRGEVLTVDEGEFDHHVVRPQEREPVVLLLEEKSIRITQRGGAIVDKTGLIALAGALKAVDTGVIAPGSRVLCCLTSGVSGMDGQAEPEVVVRGEADVLRYAEEFAGGSRDG